MIGEKHIQLGSAHDARWDGVIYSGGEPQTFVRRAGPSFPLAISPTLTVNNQFGSWHAGGVTQFVFGDGSVHGLRPSVPGTTLGFLANRSDGQVIPSYD